MVLATLAIQLRREYNTVWSSIAIASTNNFKGSDKLLISTDLLQAIVLIVTWISGSITWLATSLITSHAC